jgi:hypothetical protein
VILLVVFLAIEAAMRAISSAFTGDYSSSFGNYPSSGLLAFLLFSLVPTGLARAGVGVLRDGWLRGKHAPAETPTREAGAPGPLPVQAPRAGRVGQILKYLFIGILLFGVSLWLMFQLLNAIFYNASVGVPALYAVWGLFVGVPALLTFLALRAIIRTDRKRALGGK